MQTFLPYASFEESAACLDLKRLGKQCTETNQILDVLVWQMPSQWVHHPIVRMWRSYEGCLALYGRIMNEQWKSKYGTYRMDFGEPALHLGLPEDPPPWLGLKELHLSHKSNLIRKKPEHYGPMWPNVPNDLEYIWV